MEIDPATVLLLDDAPRQREADPPAAGLGRHAGLEQLALHERGDARAVISHAEATDRIGSRDLDFDLAAAAAQRIDGILHDDLERPFDEYRIARGSRAGARGDDLDRDREGERRQTRPEISGDALSHRAQPHRLAPRRPADALEALRHALEPLGIRLKMRDQLTARRTRILAQIINPTR